MDPIFSQQFQMPAGVGGDYGSAPRGMFGSKANLRDALMAAVAGFMARRSPQVSSNLFDAIQRKQILAQQEAQYQRRRQDELTDFTKKRQIEIDNPMPSQPGEFEQVLMASGIQPGTPEWTQAMQRRRDNILDPITMTQYGPVTRSQLVASMPTKPVGPLTPIPDGGPTPQASGGFPGY